MVQVIELLDLDDRELFDQMSSEDKYKNSSAEYRLKIFHKRQARLAREKELYVKGECSQA